MSVIQSLNGHGLDPRFVLTETLVFHWKPEGNRGTFLLLVLKTVQLGPVLHFEFYITIFICTCDSLYTVVDDP